MTCVVLKITMSQTLDALQHGSQRGYQEKELKLQDYVPFFAEKTVRKSICTFFFENILLGRVRETHLGAS